MFTPAGRGANRPGHAASRRSQGRASHFMSFSNPAPFQPQPTAPFGFAVGVVGTRIEAAEPVAAGRRQQGPADARDTGAMQFTQATINGAQRDSHARTQRGAHAHAHATSSPGLSHVPYGLSGAHATSSNPGRDRRGYVPYQPSTPPARRLVSPRKRPLLRAPAHCLSHGPAHGLSGPSTPPRQGLSNPATPPRHHGGAYPEKNDETNVTSAPTATRTEAHAPTTTRTEAHAPTARTGSVPVWCVPGHTAVYAGAGDHATAVVTIAHIDQASTP